MSPGACYDDITTAIIHTYIHVHFLYYNSVIKCHFKTDISFVQEVGTRTHVCVCVCACVCVVCVPTPRALITIHMKGMCNDAFKRRPGFSFIVIFYYRLSLCSAWFLDGNTSTC